MSGEQSKVMDQQDMNQGISHIETIDHHSGSLVNDHQQMRSKDDSSQKKRKNDFNDSTRSGKKNPSKDDFEIRFLISGKDAGALIGKKGQNITFLRQHYDCSVVVSDCAGPERVLSFTIHSSQLEQILASIISYLEENNQNPASIELRLLLHTNYVGSIIGKNGSKLKEIRQRNNTTIKIFPQCCPRSSERVCVVQGKSENVITCIRNILDIVSSHQPTGKIFYYNPANYVSHDALEYGGYLPDFNKGGNFNYNNARPPRVQNQQQQPHQHPQQPQQIQRPNRRYNNNNKYGQADMWNRNQSYYNDWQSPNHQMNYQSQMTGSMNYQQNSYQQQNSGYSGYQQQNSYQQHGNYQQQSYYVDSNSYPSSSNQMYNNKTQYGNDMQTNQVNHLNNNPPNSNHFNTFWTSFYNGSVNTKDGRTAVLTVPITNDH